MSVLTVQHLALMFGLLGNIVSFLVFLAPLPTFYNICKKKSSEGYHSIPYTVALFSATLLLYYAYLKTNAYLIISINGIGIVVEATYLIVYLIYAPKKERAFTMRLVLIFNAGGLSLVMLLTIFLVKGPERVEVFGWICAGFNLAVFVAPLSVMRQVIKTKSVEYMPFMLSFCLTLCAVTWFFYGFLVKDFYIAVPNVMGFLFGIAQMILYFIYKGKQKDSKMNVKLQTHEGDNTNIKLRSADLEMKTIVFDRNPPS